MRNIRYILFFAIASWIGNEAHAQQDPQLTLYMFNNLYYNPAFAGAEGITKISMLHRSQWLGYKADFDDGRAPQTQVLSMTAPIYKILPGASGFGLTVVNDKLGPLTNVQIQSSFAYHLGIKKSKLSFGVRLGMYSQSVNGDLYRPIDDSDTVIPKDESQIRPDLAVGVLFRAEKYYAGLSFDHLLKAEFDFGKNDLRNALENHAYLTFGYIHKVNFDITLRPSILVSTDFNIYNFTVGGYIDYKDQMWGGMSFRQGEDVNAILGYNFLKDKSLGLGYSFGYIVKAQEAKQPTSHELMLNYTLPVSPGGGKKIVRTPRFRH
jgi:type IX secretion system PorP/SprF family membrane protein